MAAAVQPFFLLWQLFMQLLHLPFWFPALSRLKKLQSLVERGTVFEFLLQVRRF